MSKKSKKCVLAIVLVLCMIFQAFNMGFGTVAQGETGEKHLTFQDFGIADHAGENAYGSTYGWSSWEDTEALLENGGSISEKITVTAMADEVVLVNNGILFFSNMNDWDGIKMNFDTANDQLYCQVTDSLRGGEDMSGDSVFAIKPADVGRTESFFSSTGFELKLAFTPNGNDLLLSIYIDGVKYMGNEDTDVVDGVITIPNAISVIKASKGQTGWERNSIWCMLPDVDLDLVAPVEDGATGQNLTFQDFGIADHAGENAYGSTYGWSSWEDMETLLENGGSISEKITVTAMADEVVLVNNGILFFSNMNDWDGIKMNFDTANDQLYCQVTDSLRGGEDMTGDSVFAIKPADVGRTESFFSSTGFELKLAFTPNGNDLLLSIYIDGVQYMGNEDTDVVDGVITIPNAISVIKASKGQTGWERNSIWCMLPDVDLDLVAPVGDGATGQNLTFQDFGIADHAGENAYGSTYGWSSWEDMETLLENGGSISEKITVTAMADEVVLVNNGILFFSNMNEWDGIKFNFDTVNDQLYCQVTDSLRGGEDMSGDSVFAITPADVGRTESFFSSTGFELKLAFTPNGNDLLLSIYIDGVQYMGNEDTDVVDGVITIPNAISVIKASKGQTGWERNSIWCMLPDVDLDLVAPNDSGKYFKTITFSDYNISDDTYAATFACGSTTKVSSMDGVEFKGQVVFPAEAGWDAALYIGAPVGADPSQGIAVLHAGAGIYLFDVTPRTGGAVELCHITEAMVGKTLGNSPIEVGMSFEYVNETDVVVRFSIDGTKYYEGTLEGLASHLGPQLMVDSKGLPITVASVGGNIEEDNDKVTEDESDLTVLTFSDYGINAATYEGTFVTGLTNAVTNMDKVKFKGQVVFPAEAGWGAALYIAAPTGYDPSQGIAVLHAGAGIYLFDVTPRTGGAVELCHIPEAVVGKALGNSPIEVGMSFEYVNETDVIVRFSIDGFVYYEGTVEGLVGHIGPQLMVNSTELPITIASVDEEIDTGDEETGPPPTIDSSFKKINFNSFEIVSDTYKKAGLYLSTEGNCGLSSMDRVVFSDTIHFSDTHGAQLRIAGGISAWHGLMFMSCGGGRIQMVASETNITPIMFSSKMAGVDLTDRDLELTLSFEYIDHDGDGQKDDVKLGVFFDGIPYKNKWIYLPDFVPQLGGNCGLYFMDDNSFITIKTTSEPVDFEEYGFTKNWKQELGLK